MATASSWDGNTRGTASSSPWMTEQALAPNRVVTSLGFFIKLTLTKILGGGVMCGVVGDILEGNLLASHCCPWACKAANRKKVVDFSENAKGRGGFIVEDQSGKKRRPQRDQQS